MDGDGFQRSRRQWMETKTGICLPMLPRPVRLPPASSMHARRGTSALSAGLPLAADEAAAAAPTGRITTALGQTGSFDPLVSGKIVSAGRTLSPRELWLAAICAGLLLAAGIAITPFARIALLPLPGFTVAQAIGSVILDLLVAILLVAREPIEHDGSRLYFAAAYFFAALVIVPHIAAFPDTLTPGYLAGSASSAIWLWVFWHFGFAAFIIRYGLSAPKGRKRRRLTGALLVIALAALSAFIGLVEARHLPVIIAGSRYFFGVAGHLVTAVVLLANLLGLLAVCTRLRNHRGEDLWLAVGMVGACMDVWLVINGGQRFSLGWYGSRTIGFSTTFMVFVSLMNDMLQTYKRVTLANDILDRLTVTDPLTKLGNRRIFDLTLENEWRRCRRDMLPLSVVMLDVDHFKSYNDAYGHQAGDRCLETVATCLHKAASRAGDLATRYGGEEFALILPATDSGGAAYVANLVRLTVRDAAMIHSGSEKQVITISAGVATLVPSESFDASELVKLADQALYRAKANGRDNVAIAG